MAPFGLSRQSGWGQAASGGGSAGGFNGGLSAVIALLVIGSLVGFALASFIDSDDEGQRGAERLIGYRVTDMATADRTEGGAAKAATALLIGLPALSISPSDEVTRVLNQTVAPSDDPAARVALDGVVEAARRRLVGNEATLGGPVTAKILVVPASYRIRIIDENNMIVTIWRSTVFLEATNAEVASIWTTDDVGLRWDGRWKVSSYTQSLGPTPPFANETQEPSSYADVQQVLNNAYAYQPSLAGP